MSFVSASADFLMNPGMYVSISSVNSKCSRRKFDQFPTQEARRRLGRIEDMAFVLLITV
jgi:hypothetical protein